MMKQCSKCARFAAPNATICNGCGDQFVGNYFPMLLLIGLLIPALAFLLVVSRQQGFTTHPQRVALAQLGLGPSEDAISAAQVSDAKRRGIVQRQRDLFAFDVDEGRWNRMSDLDRSRLKEAFVQRVYGRELQGDDVVKIYAGASRRMVTSIKGRDVHS